MPDAWSLCALHHVFLGGVALQEQLAIAVPAAASTAGHPHAHLKYHAATVDSSNTSPPVQSALAQAATASGIPGAGAKRVSGVGGGGSGRGMAEGGGVEFALLTAGTLAGKWPPAVATSAAACMALPTSMLLSQQVGATKFGRFLNMRTCICA